MRGNRNTLNNQATFQFLCVSILVCVNIQLLQHLQRLCENTRADLTNTKGHEETALQSSKQNKGALNTADIGRQLSWATKPCRTLLLADTLKVIKVTGTLQVVI